MYGIETYNDALRSLKDSGYAFSRIRNKYNYTRYRVGHITTSYDRKGIYMEHRLSNPLRDNSVVVINKGAIMCWKMDNNNISFATGTFGDSQEEDVSLWFFSPYEYVPPGKNDYGIEVRNKYGEVVFGNKIQPLRILGYITKKQGKPVWYRQPKSNKIGFIQLGSDMSWGNHYIGSSIATQLSVIDKNGLDISVKTVRIPIKQNTIIDGIRRYDIGFRARENADVIWLIVDMSNYDIK